MGGSAGSCWQHWAANPLARELAVREREGVRRYSLARGLAAWAAAAVPTALLAWVVAPVRPYRG
jgi:hypothetical protein